MKYEIDNNKKVKNFFKIICIQIISLIVLVNGNISLANNNSQSVQEKRRDTKAKILYLKMLEHRETNKLYQNQLRLEKTSKKLTFSKDRYDDTKNKLAKTEYEFNKLIQEYSIYEFNARNRIRKIYKKERNGLLEFLLSSENFSDFLDRIYFQKLLLKNDKYELNVLKVKAEKIEKLRDEIRQQKDYLSSSIAEMKYQKKSIQEAINQNEQMINKLKTDRATYERAERELAQQSAKIGSMITSSVKTKTNISSGFIKPISGPITSPFGWRVHPIFKSRTFHSGIDIAGPNGGAIVASNSGKVIYVGWYSGYGKVVIIDHGLYKGKPTTTLYAHMSGFAVSNGQCVKRGQTIGYEGSTGYSTGPHCHFEVRVNGKVQNPFNYI